MLGFFYKFPLLPAVTFVYTKKLCYERILITVRSNSNANILIPEFYRTKNEITSSKFLAFEVFRFSLIVICLYTICSKALFCRKNTLFMGIQFYYIFIDIYSAVSGDNFEARVKLAVKFFQDSHIGHEGRKFGQF